MLTPIVDSLAVVAAVIAVVVIAASVGRPAGHGFPAAGAEATAIVLTPASAGPGSRSALNADVAVLRHRLRSSFSDVKLALVGDAIVLTHIPRAQRPNVLRLTVPGRLRFPDWEANALTPQGKTVASQLPTQDPRATQISQGSGLAVPGSIGAVGLPVYQGVKLAASQPAAKREQRARRQGILAVRRLRRRRLRDSGQGPRAGRPGRTALSALRAGR